MTVTLYNAGTADFTNGSANVVGHGTTWANLVQGDVVVGPDGKFYELTPVDDTHYTLDRNYAGTTALASPGGTWNILRASAGRDSIRTSSKQLTALSADYRQIVNTTSTDQLLKPNRASTADNAGVFFQTGGADNFRAGLFTTASWRFQTYISGVWTDSISIDKTTGSVSIPSLVSGLTTTYTPRMSALAATQNFNAVVVGGSYFTVDNASTNTPTPGAPDYWYLRVTGYTDPANYALQEAWSLTANSDVKYTRKFLAATWSAWTKSMAAAANLSDLANKAVSYDNLSVHGADIASASTVNLETATGRYVRMTGITTINAITLADGHERTVYFVTGGSGMKLTNGASLALPGNADIQVHAGDIATFIGDGSVVRCTTYVANDFANSLLGIGAAGLNSFNLFSNAQAIAVVSTLALAVGPNGVTNPSFGIDTTVTLAATGIRIKASAAGVNGGPGISVLSSSPNEPLNIDAKGTGPINIASATTGPINLFRTVNGSGGFKSLQLSTVEWTITHNGATNRIVIATGANAIVSPYGRGVATIAESQSFGSNVVFNMNQGTIIIMNDSTSGQWVLSATPAAGKIGIAVVSGNYVVYNNSGSTIQVSFAGLRAD